MGNFFSRFNNPAALAMAAIALALYVQNLAKNNSNNSGVVDNKPMIASGSTQSERAPAELPPNVKNSDMSTSDSEELKKKLASEKALHERFATDSAALKDCNTHRASLQGLEVPAVAQEGAAMPSGAHQRTIQEVDLSIKHLEIKSTIRKIDLENCRSGLAADEAKLKQYKIVATQLSSSVGATAELLNQCYKEKRVNKSASVSVGVDPVYNLKEAETRLALLTKVSTDYRNDLETCKKSRVVTGGAPATWNDNPEDRFFKRAVNK